MPVDNWDRVQEIFLAAADLPSAEQSRFLDAACLGEVDLREEVESLLRADSASEASLAAAIEAEAGSLLEEEPIVGLRLGAYRVVRPIGRGGMGAVYLAERDDDQYRKQVAIKIVKRGMDTAELLGRFRHERQILANLEHPYIARLVDGGATPDGRPFLVMEYVEGQPIDAYCRDRNLDLKARLRLFLRVCEAVSFAHRNLVVHRDLKPGNILVTAEGAPKLLDFGVAKLLTPALDSGLTATAFPIGPLTPDYASPEQVRGLRVTAATDVYALGAVLYELLTGTRAQRITTRTPHEIERVVCATEVLRPSATAADAGLRRQLVGDLDNVLLTAMRKESERRYQSVDDLAADIQRYFDGLPVMARRDAVPYRIGKYLGRNRRAIAAVAVVLASVLAGAAVTIWQTRKAAAIRREPSRTEGPILTRLTFDSGLTMEPEVSPDGKLVAYVSDRGGKGNFDLWVQPVDGGEPLRLTRTPGDERYPRFSPDGTRIVYYVERANAAGIYVVSARGGEPQRIVERGFYPRFSPDGRYIAYLLGASTRSNMGRSIALVSVSSGEPREIPTELSMISSPVWSPDGNLLLVRGMSKGASAAEAKFGWYLVPIGAGKPRPVEVEPALRKAGIMLPGGSLPEPNFWYKQRVLFMASIGDSQNLWEISLSPSGSQVTGVPRRLTFDSETEGKDASVGGNGLVAFASYTSERHVYRLSGLSRLSRAGPGGSGRGKLERLTTRAGWYYGLRVSGDGRKLLYADDYPSRSRILLRDLASGKETALSFLAPEGVRYPPVLSPDAARIAYQRRLQGRDNDERTEIVVRGLDGGPAEPLCENCGTPWIWFPDGQHLATSYTVSSSRPDGGRHPVQLGSRIVDLASKQARSLDAPPGHVVSILSLSPDGGWAAVRLTKLPLTAVPQDEIFLASLQRDNLAPPAEWVPVPVRVASSSLEWAPDGDSLYFFSDTAEDYFLKALTLNPATRKPGGGAQTVYRHDSPSFLVYAGAGLAVTRESVIFSASENKGNIWLMKLAE